MSDWAVILGSSSGFGAATARALAKKGIHIYGVHLDRRAAMEPIDKLIGELKSEGVHVIFNNVSATDEPARKQIVAELSGMENIRVKILMHSLAFGALKPVIGEDLIHSLTQRQIEMTLDVMACSILYWAQDLFYAGLLQKGSQIFGMTSSGGHRQWQSYGAVSAAKAALESYCRQLAVELCSHGIASNTIQAGVTNTPALRKIPGSADMIDYAVKLNPGGRLTVPDDVAQTIALLGLSENSWLTGNTIRVDGGEDIMG